MKELGAAFILAGLFIVLFLLGALILPKEFLADLPSEIIILLGFVVILLVLYLFSSVIYIFRKLRKNKNSASTEEATIEKNTEELAE